MVAQVLEEVFSDGDEMDICLREMLAECLRGEISIGLWSLKGLK